MAKNAMVVTGLNKLKQGIKQLRQEVAQMGSELPKRICDVFRDRARKRLIANTHSQNINVQSLAMRIQSVPYKNGAYIRIYDNEEGLMMFLEYGTGLKGEADNHQMSGEIGWGYALNRENPKIYKSYNDKLGWIFEYDSNDHYIGSDDEVWEYDYKTLIFTQGIKPVRYLYNTLIEIQDTIRRANGNYKTLIQMLDALEKRDVEREMF